MSSGLEPHELGENAIRELSRHLYKYPKSAIKECVTNGLDQQSARPKEARIDITTHVGPDDDLWIQDYGTGIEDYAIFKKFLRGQKEVEGRVSSYENIDPEIGGNKGLGKLGFLMLAGGDNPTVEFYSHRPKTDRYSGQGLKVTMTEQGFVPEYMDSIEALEKPGVRVVIKHCRWDLLPRETELIKYISKMFAIRISRGTQIYFDGNRISKPEGFISKADQLFQLDSGDWIKGNFVPTETPEGKNVWIANKNIFVDDLWMEHRVFGWLNDDHIVPTSSREDIEDTQRWIEIKQKLRLYLDEHYPVPKMRELGKMGREKEKTDLLIKLLQNRDHILSGTYDQDGIFGEISEGGEAKNKPLKKKENVTLTHTGNENGPPVIPIGDGKRGKGGRHGGTGNAPGFEEGGDHDILTNPEDTDTRIKQGPIRPEVKIVKNPFGINYPMAFFSDNGNTFNWNTFWPQTVKAFKANGPDWKYLIGPVYAQALANFDRETVEPNMDLAKWQQRYSTYIKLGIEG